jgi:DNA-binding CsgD family transcriptional regulator
MTTEINTQGVLTPREEQALRYIAEGKTIKDAARCMGIATATAYDHVENAKSKVAAETTPHAISILWARGYLREIAAAMLLIALYLPLAQALTDSTGDEPLRTTRLQRRGGTQRGRVRTRNTARRKSRAGNKTSRNQQEAYA